MFLNLIKSVNIEPVVEFSDDNLECFAIKIILSKQSFGSAASSFEFSTNESNLKLKINVNREVLEGAKKQSSEVCQTPSNILSVQSVSSKKPKEITKKRRISDSIICIDQEEAKIEEKIKQPKIQKRKTLNKTLKVINSKFSLDEYDDDVERMNDTESESENDEVEYPIQFKNKLKTEKINLTYNVKQSEFLNINPIRTEKGNETKSNESKLQLKNYKRNTKNLKFICIICNKSFKNAQNLKHHTWTHDKNREKRFKCDICQYGSDFNSQLKKHKLIHQKREACSTLKES
ncbi:hypothetical protein PVAND_007585 [Polypedilum vanderplanki]|uniref:C2H2-type domain-containing protein n=1 Tax=Polypedilum vanderplanki TaxID=319348 RepID=A0A9J6C7T1_POLVA|nr:hypothetical protein PVAND_007585 [Polypedilum vanderplanki]